MTWFIVTPSDSDLMHHGVKGQKWGVRRYQNKDGSLTALGKSRQHGGKEITEEEVQKALRKRFDDAEMEIKRRRYYLTESLIKKYGDKPYKDIENPKRIAEAKKEVEKYGKLRDKFSNENKDLFEKYLDKRYSKEGISSEEEQAYRDKAKTLGNKAREYDDKHLEALVKYQFFTGEDITRKRTSKYPLGTPKWVYESIKGDENIKRQARELWYSKLKRGN